MEKTNNHKDHQDHVRQKDNALITVEISEIKNVIIEWCLLKNYSIDLINLKR